MLYRLLVSVLFIFFKDPESVHRLALSFLALIGLPGVRNITSSIALVDDVALRQTVFGIEFPNPVGIAAGFDKDAEVTRGLEALGFGYIEAGTITKNPQPGNPRPRVFRFEKEAAIINRVGFSNKGAGAVSRRLTRDGRATVPLGISIGKSKVTELDEAAQDYRFSLERLYEHGDYFVINVSSPNTPELRKLQGKEHLVAIVKIWNEFREKQKERKPFLVKIAPDLSYEAVDEVLDVCEHYKLDGIVAVNTTVARQGVSKRAAGISGGLSGAPIKNIATEFIRYIRRKKPSLPIVGVGGIFTAEDAYEKIKAGASLVQVYTGFIYKGPFIASDINRGLLELLKRDGYENIKDAIGKE